MLCSTPPSSAPDLAHKRKWKTSLVLTTEIVLFVPYSYAFMVPTNAKIMALHGKTMETREQYREGVMSDDGETIHQLVDKWGMRNLGRFAIVAVSSFVAVGTALMDKTEY